LEKWQGYTERITRTGTLSEPIRVRRTGDEYGALKRPFSYPFTVLHAYYQHTLFLFHLDLLLKYTALEGHFEITI
jgi:hypothetical protein